ncbi:hypothetical protein CMV_001586 [Castanea mollissima]|uniref:Uncharacterized protein n=1 Tax=Castanea mollissima TaxID=60419 RepID=A0A8J4W4A4_9ROSI|nr:hypothetical protein CMV_001586 [Castanea mollissima]
MELGVDFEFGIGMNQRRSEIMVAVWVWVDDRVMEEEDLDGGGKGLFLQLGFWVEVTDLDKDGDESQESYYKLIPAQTATWLPNLLLMHYGLAQSSMLCGSLILLSSWRLPLLSRPLLRFCIKPSKTPVALRCLLTLSP